MPENIDLPLSAEESAAIPQLARAYQKLQRGPAVVSEDNILRMILDGGLLKNKERVKADALPALPDPTPRTLIALDPSVGELEDLQERWGLSREEVLRIVVVDGLAYVEEALHAFGQGYRMVPEKKGQA